MTGFLIHILLASLCLTLIYGFYILVLKNKINFTALRYYLLGGVMIALILPLSDYSIDLERFTLHTILPDDIRSSGIEGRADSFSLASRDPVKTTETRGSFPWPSFLFLTYLFVSFFLFLRLIRQVVVLIGLLSRGDGEKWSSYWIIRLKDQDHTFSFFKWIFLGGNLKSHEQDQILKHEWVHASQGHTFDVMLAELMICLMWFNPIVWCYRNEIQLNNEYIADNTVLLSGIHKQRYQALLLNQAAEGKLVSLSSMFNRSLIQKRFIMMTQFKSRKKSGLRILGLIPVLVFFFFGMACINGQKEKDAEKSEMITAVALPKMNVLYIGVNNPVTISVSGYQPEELEVTIDNGVIEGGNGEYEVRVARPGTARITVFANGEKVNQKEFRVKSVPDPVARIGQSGGGTISSDALLQAEGVDAYIPDFDFDIAFRVMSFKMTCTDPQTNAPIELDAPSAKFTESQREMIRSLSADQQILFSEIKAMGPDGSARKLPPLAYILK